MNSSFLGQTRITGVTPVVLLEAPADSQLVIPRITVGGTGALRLMLDAAGDATLGVEQALAWDLPVVGSLSVAATSETSPIIIPRGGRLAGACGGAEEALTITLFGYATGRNA